MTGLVWWYPVVAWGVAFAALAHALVALRASVVPRWLPPAVGCLAIVPIAGLPLGRWLHGLGQTFSIPFLAVLLDPLVAPFLGRARGVEGWLDPPARRAAVWWAAGAAVVLYPAALGVGGFDPYALGWSDPGVAAAAAVGGVLLALAGNRFGTVLLVAGISRHLGLLESDNAWDYLVDPAYAAAGLVNLTWQGCSGAFRRHPSAVVGRALAAVVAAGLLGTALAAAEPVVGSALDERWEATARDLVRRAERAGHAELAALVRDWRLPDVPGRQRILRIPEAVVRPGFVDTEQEAIWNDFLAARRARAEGLFALAVEAARAHAKLPTRVERGRGQTAKPLAQATTTAVRLVYEALRDDPDHEGARKAVGWVRRDGRWVWPEVARRLDAGEVRDAERGWITKSAADRPPAARPGRPATWASDHWRISSQAGPAAAAALAAEMELAHDVWRQAFGGFLVEPAEQERAFEGRARPAGHGPFAATLFADRASYVAELEKLEPTIARTLGLYWMPTHTAYFFPAGEDADEPGPATIHHEAAHQLFAEMRKTSPLAGERCGFWAMEAAACYLESLVATADGWTLGGRDAGRALAAGERLIDDDFYVPLAELCALGRRELQADERLPAIYSQISGLVDFFMNGEQARYREAFVEYLVRIYTGSVSPDTLARLCGTSHAELDDAYRRHMARP